MEKRIILHGGDIYKEDIYKESTGGGESCGCKVRLDFSVNTNPLGIPFAVQQRLRESVGHWNRYPDPRCGELTARLAGYHGIGEEQIVCGNGAADLIDRLVRALRPPEALLPAPVFMEYERALREWDCEIRFFELREEEGFVLDADRFSEQISGMSSGVVFLCNPNNPTGQAVRAAEIEKVAGACCRRGILLVIDECFCEFLDPEGEYSFISRLSQYPETVILRAFTKSFALAGLRLGYALCGDPHLAERLKNVGQPWSVSLPAQEAGLGVLDLLENAAGGAGYLEESRRLIRRERERLREELTRLGFRVIPSDANFLLFQDIRGGGKRDLWKECRRRGFLIRDCRDFRGLEQGRKASPGLYYRICVGAPGENRQLMEVFSEICRE